MAKMSREKGKRGERELASILREWFPDARRGVQYKGGPDSPDVTGIPGFHVECKRVERGNPYEWLDQAIEDAGADETPFVAHRRNNHDWIAVINLADLLNMIHKLHEFEERDDSH